MRSWLCTWILDCAAHAPRAAQAAPEIDGSTIFGAVVMVLAVTAIWRGR